MYQIVYILFLNICRASLCQGQCLKSLPLCCTHSFFSHRTRKRHDSTSFMPPLETNDLKIYKICVFSSIIWGIGSRHFLFHNLLGLVELIFTRPLSGALVSGHRAVPLAFTLTFSFSPLTPSTRTKTPTITTLSSLSSMVRNSK